MLLSLGVLLAFASTSLADCPPNTFYEPFFNKCYVYYSNPLPFLGAERQCNSIGGNLVAVQSDVENNFVKGLTSGATGIVPNFWIGANEQITTTWGWTYNTPMFYTNWAQGQPGAGMPCALIRYSDYKWITGPCNNALPFVCSVDPSMPQPDYCPTPAPVSCPVCTQPPAPTTTSPPPFCSGNYTCAKGYTFFKGSCMCYKYTKNPMVRSDAADVCARDGGSLVKIDSPALNDFLTNLPGFSCGGSSCPWIGLHCFDAKVKDCRWPDGSVPGYTNFYQGQVADDWSDYVLLASNSYSGQWESSPENNVYSVMCQKPPKTN